MAAVALFPVYDASMEFYYASGITVGMLEFDGTCPPPPEILQEYWPWCGVFACIIVPVIGWFVWIIKFIEYQNIKCQWRRDVASRTWVGVDLASGQFIKIADVNRDRSAKVTPPVQLAPVYRGARAMSSNGASLFVFFDEYYLETESLSLADFNSSRPFRNFNAQPAFVSNQSRLASYSRKPLDAQLRHAIAYLPLQCSRFLVIFQDHAEEVDSLQQPAIRRHLRCPPEFQGADSLTTDPLGQPNVVYVHRGTALECYHIRFGGEPEAIQIVEHHQTATITTPVADFLNPLNVQMRWKHVFGVCHALADHEFSIKVSFGTERIDRHEESTVNAAGLAMYAHGASSISQNNLIETLSVSESEVKAHLNWGIKMLRGFLGAGLDGGADASLFEGFQHLARSSTATSGQGQASAGAALLHARLHSIANERIWREKTEIEHKVSVLMGKPCHTWQLQLLGTNADGCEIETSIKLFQDTADAEPPELPRGSEVARLLIQHRSS